MALFGTRCSKRNFSLALFIYMPRIDGQVKSSSSFPYDHYHCCNDILQIQLLALQFSGSAETPYITDWNYIRAGSAAVFIFMIFGRICVLNSHNNKKKSAG
jgi:hypothetical protein